MSACSTKRTRSGCEARKLRTVRVILDVVVARPEAVAPVFIRFLIFEVKVVVLGVIELNHEAINRRVSLLHHSDFLQPIFLYIDPVLTRDYGFLERAVTGFSSHSREN